MGFISISGCVVRANSRGTVVAEREFESVQEAIEFKPEAQKRLLEWEAKAYRRKAPLPKEASPEHPDVIVVTKGKRLWVAVRRTMRQGEWQNREFAHFGFKTRSGAEGYARKWAEAYGLAVK
jgi:hypothetical protein